MKSKTKSMLLAGVVVLAHTAAAAVLLLTNVAASAPSDNVTISRAELTATAQQSRLMFSVFSARSQAAAMEGDLDTYLAMSNAAAAFKGRADYAAELAAR